MAGWVAGFQAVEFPRERASSLVALAMNCGNEGLVPAPGLRLN